MWSWRLGRKQLKPWGTGSQQDFFSSLGASLCAGRGSQGSPEDVPGPQAVEGRLRSYTGLCDQSLGSPSVKVSYRHSGVVTVRRHSFGFWSGSGLVLGISLQTHRGLPTATQASIYDEANSCSSLVLTQISPPPGKPSLTTSERGGAPSRALLQQPSL